MLQGADVARVVTEVFIEVPAPSGPVRMDRFAVAPAHANNLAWPEWPNGQLRQMT